MNLWVVKIFLLTPYYIIIFFYYERSLFGRNLVSLDVKCCQKMKEDTLYASFVYLPRLTF